jgi:DNA-binding CsgD family transcriptional regulator
MPSRPAFAAPAHQQAVEAISGMIACIGSSGFAHEAIAQINRWLPVSWWSVFRLYDDAPPVMPASGSYQAEDHTAESWQEYRSSLYRQDETFVAAREQVQGPAQMLVHWHAREIPHAHRERIYTRFGLRERLSLVCRSDADASMLAVNLYRHEDLPAFSDQEIDLVGSAAGMLLSCVRRHLELSGPQSYPDLVLGGLTKREREVCDRMLKGWTYDGIAVDLGVSAGTVKTYRDRAFDRLGIHHRNELFALVSGYRN